MSLRQGDIVLVKGSLSTQETEKKFICKKCGHEMIKHEAVVIYIDPLHIKKFASGLSTEEGLKEIENNIEISNEIMITGTLCREPAYYKENNIRNCQFQIAANRKRRIIEDGPEKRTDFPWIKTFGEMAEEISGVLHQGSVISICGGVETRSFERKIICENCGEEFERKEYATEIVPYFIDYVDNCDIPVKHEDDFVDSENESYINSEEMDLDKKNNSNDYDESYDDYGDDYDDYYDSYEDDGYDESFQ